MHERDLNEFLSGMPVLENANPFEVKKIAVGSKLGSDSPEFVIIGRTEQREVYVSVAINPSYSNAFVALELIIPKFEEGGVEVTPGDFLVRNLRREGILPVEQLWIGFDKWKKLNDWARFPEDPFSESVPDLFNAHGKEWCLLVGRIRKFSHTAHSLLPEPCRSTPGRPCGF